MATMQVESKAVYSYNPLPDIQTKGIYEGRVRDRTPNISPAGKLTATGETTQLCMHPQSRPDSPEVIRRFRNTLRPDAGKTRIFYGKAYDPQLKWAAGMTHGLATQPSLIARDLVNPQPNSLFRQRLFDKKESIYASHQRAPLSRSHDQSIGLPQGLNPNQFTFGIRSEKDGCAGELVNPDKPRNLVNQEGEVGRDLYRRTHADYCVGEQCNRNYTYNSFNRDGKFGIPTPHENDGRHIKKTLHWVHDSQCERAAPVVNKRVDDFRERTQPQLGKVHDPIKDTMHVPADHTFGILIKPDEYGVGDLMHARGPGDYLRGKDRLRGVVAAMRQHLKKANYHNFHDLITAFRHYDKDRSNTIDMAELREACIQFHLPAEPELLEQLMDYCGQDGKINYVEFANFLNWKDKLPSDARLTQSAPPGVSRDESVQLLQKQIDMALGNHRTSSSMISAVVGGIPTQGYRTYGVPTMRTDLPAPRIKRVSDRTNYGDESDAYGLMNPSMYSTKGVNEKDFLMPRSREEIRDIFTDVGVNMTYDTFEDTYKLASAQHPKGHVSVESFRNVIDEMQAAQLQKRGLVY